MKIEYSSNDGEFIMETIRKGEILDRIKIVKTNAVFEMSELGFTTMLVLMAQADPKFYEKIRTIYCETHPMKSPSETVDDLQRIQNLEEAIRKHRDAKGHDRCWLNDKELYKVLPETSPSEPELPPTKAEFMEGCRKYCDGQYEGLNDK